MALEGFPQGALETCLSEGLESLKYTKSKKGTFPMKLVEPFPFIGLQSLPDD